MVHNFVEQWGDSIFISCVIILTVLLSFEFARLRIEVNQMRRFIIRDYKTRMRKERKEHDNT